MNATGVLLKLLFVMILICMLWLTGVASLDRGVFTAGSELWTDPWFRVTLFDAYFSFLIIYLWLAYRERDLISRLLWLLLFLALGSIAASLYILIQLFRVESKESPATLLLPRREDS